MSKLSNRLQIILGIPKDGRSSGYIARLGNLLMLEIHLLVAFAVIARISNSTLVFEKLNFISLTLLSLSIAVCYANFKHPSEYVSFLIVGVIAITLLTQSVLLNVDRSRSLYVLGWVAIHQLEIVDGKANLGTVRSPSKFDENGINLRIQEQIDRNLIYENEGELKLTLQGRIIVSISDLLSDAFDLRGWKENRN